LLPFLLKPLFLNKSIANVKNISNGVLDVSTFEIKETKTAITLSRSMDNLIISFPTAEAKSIGSVSNGLSKKTFSYKLEHQMEYKAEVSADLFGAINDVSFYMNFESKPFFYKKISDHDYLDGFFLSEEKDFALVKIKTLKSTTEYKLFYSPLFTDKYIFNIKKINLPE
jgi:hypothetical protein